MKYLLSVMLSISILFGFGACDTCKKLPICVSVDFSKKGTVYETDFQVPWNIWGSNIGFFIVPKMDIKDANTHSKIYEDINTGYKHDGDGYLKPPKHIPYFKVKITLTPLGWASHDVVILYSNRKEKIFTKKDSIEIIASVPLYGSTPIVINWFDHKTIMIADLQRLRNYHVKIETLETVEIPSFINTKFCIRSTDRKH